MGVFNRKGTVRDGLVLELDAANQKSRGADQTKWKDTTSQGNDGTLTNGPVHSQGPFPGAGYVNIDGTSRTQGLTLPSVSTVMGNGTGDWTIEFWYMTPSFTTSGGTTTVIPLINNIYWYDGNNGSFWSIVNSDRKIALSTQHSGGAFGTSVDVVSTSTISTGVWYHIAFVKQGNTLRLYFNGVQEDTDTVTNLSSSGFNSSGNALSIGRWYNYISSAPDTSEFGIGNFSNVRIVNSAVYPDGTSFTPQVSELTAVPNIKLLTCQKGTITDTSVSGHSITVTGNAAAVYNDVSYFEFDGNDDYVDLGTIPTSNVLQMNNPSGGGLTVSWWGYFDDTGDDYQRIFDKSNGGTASNGWAIYTSITGSNTASLHLGSAGTDQVISNSYLTSTWQNWCVTWVKSSGTYVTYLNGVQDKTGTRTWNVPSSQTNARIGSWNHSTGREYNGKIACLKIYDKALTSTEVTKNFNAHRARFGI